MRGWMGRDRPTLGQWPANHGRSLANWMRRQSYRRVESQRVPFCLKKDLAAIAAVVFQNSTRSQSRCTIAKPPRNRLFHRTILDWHLFATTAAAYLAAASERVCMCFYRSLQISLDIDLLFFFAHAQNCVYLCNDRTVLSDENVLLENTKQSLTDSTEKRKQRKITTGVTGVIRRTTRNLFKQLDLVLPAWLFSVDGKFERVHRWR